MRRREFITLLGGAVVTPVLAPLTVRAQQSERLRRIGVVLPFPMDNPESRVRVTTFLQELEQLGWTVGGNVQIEYRWDAGDPNSAVRKLPRNWLHVSGLIFATGSPVVAALQLATRTVPIVFVNVPMLSALALL